MAETVTITSKGQITIPSRLRKKLGIEEGKKLLIFDEGKELRMIPVPKLSELAGVDEALFKGRKPSKELKLREMSGQKSSTGESVRSSVLLDTKPLIKLFAKEDGWEEVRTILSSIEKEQLAGAISVLSLTEIYDKYLREHRPDLAETRVEQPQVRYLSQESECR